MKNKKGNMGIVIALIIIGFVIGLIIYSLVNNYKEINGSSTNIENTENKELEQTKEEAPVVEEETIPQKNQMEKISKNGDVLVMNYTGRFTNGTVFDSNVDPKFNHVQPFEFTLGAGMVIKGWDEGLLGMKVGEKKTLTIPPEKAYGPNDYNGIPGGSTLIFEVELVDIK